MRDDAEGLPATVLVVDDEPELRALVCDYLAHHGLVMRTAADAAQARLIVAQGLPDLAILDIGLPGESGLALAQWLRAAHPQIGLVMLSAAGSTLDRVAGLEQGADDYLSKPFEPRELLARVRALLRRLGRNADAPDRPPADASAAAPDANSAPQRPSPALRFGLCTLDPLLRTLVDAQGAEVAITTAEYDLLWLFACHPHQPLHRDRIMAEAHHRSWGALDRSIDLRIMRLRRKIEANPDKPEVLKTVRNVGYVFVPAPLAPALAPAQARAWPRPTR